MFPDIRDVLTASGLKSSNEFAQALLDEHRVAVTPGEAFDAPGFLRLSYATSMENLREGSRRLLEFVSARAGASTQPHLASTTAR
jgi:aspartate aminotransferase